MSTEPAKKPWYRILYVQVLIAVALGIVTGMLFPLDPKHPEDWSAADLEPLGLGFVNLVKMMIAPIIFCTVVHGIASMGDLKKLGRVGIKTLIYFEVVSTVALIIGLVVVNVLKPGEGFNFDPAKTEAVSKSDIAKTEDYKTKGEAMSTTKFLLNIIPKSFFSPFAESDGPQDDPSKAGKNTLLQVLFIAIISAFALTFMGERGKAILHVIEKATEFFFAVIHILVKFAPIGAFGAMAFTVASYGIGSLNKLLALMAGFYITAGFFVVLVLGAIAKWAGFSIFRLLVYMKDELLLVLGTSSSETALPGMVEKMQRLGCSKSTVGLVIPTGYSFNLDGTNIYMTMAAIFLAQATNTPLTLGQQITLLVVAMLTSKGASGVTGAGYITLAATLESVQSDGKPIIPLASLALLIGIDRFMSECRALTNLVGNGVATVVISRWEKEVSAEELQANMRKPVHAHAKPIKTEEEE